VEALAAA
jgi:HNH endonuclease